MSQPFTLLSTLSVLSTLQSVDVAAESYWSQLSRPTNESSPAARRGSVVTSTVVLFYIEPSTLGRVPFIDAHVGLHVPSDVFAKPWSTPIRPQPERALDAKLEAPFVYTVGLGVGEMGDLGVIHGWDAASVGIRAGERRLITVPPGDGYWSGGYPSYLDLGRRFPHVPKDATLVIDLQCIEVTCERDECHEPPLWPPPPPIVRYRA